MQKSSFCRLCAVSCGILITVCRGRGEGRTKQIKSAVLCFCQRRETCCTCFIWNFCLLSWAPILHVCSFIHETISTEVYGNAAVNKVTHLLKWLPDRGLDAGYLLGLLLQWEWVTPGITNPLLLEASVSLCFQVLCIPAGVQCQKHERVWWLWSCWTCAATLESCCISHSHVLRLQLAGATSA